MRTYTSILDLRRVGSVSSICAVVACGPAPTEGHAEGGGGSETSSGSGESSGSTTSSGTNGAETTGSDDGDVSTGEDVEDVEDAGSDTDAETDTDTDVEPGPLANFAGADPDAILYAIETALGRRALEAYSAMLQAEVHSEASLGACPGRRFNGVVLTIDASGCTTEDGFRYEGQIAATNAITLGDLIGQPAYDPSSPVRIELDAFTFEAPDGRSSFDGAVEQSSPEADDYTAHSVLRVTSPRGTSSEDLSTVCIVADEVRTCTYDLGTATVEGVGTFTIEGSIGAADGLFSGGIDLLGEQLLRVDLDEEADGCYPYSIDDVPSGTICVSSELPPPVEL